MNPLIEKIEQEMHELGMGDAKLVQESYDAQSFGNAEAIYDWGHLRLYFVRDRGQDILSLSSQRSPNNYYPFCDVSVMMGWETFSEIISVIEPINLKKALSYIKKDFSKLESSFSVNELFSTRSKLKKIEQKRVEVMFG